MKSALFPSHCVCCKPCDAGFMALCCKTVHVTFCELSLEACLPRDGELRQRAELQLCCTELLLLLLFPSTVCNEMAIEVLQFPSSSPSWGFLSPLSDLCWIATSKSSKGESQPAWQWMSGAEKTQTRAPNNQDEPEHLLELGVDAFTCFQGLFHYHRMQLAGECKWL